MDTRPGSTSVASEDDFLYDYLLDIGVLNDVHTVAESIVSSSTSSSLLLSLPLSATTNNDDAQRIVDRLLERNADEIDRELAAIVRKVKLGAEVDVAGTRSVDFRWPRTLDIGPGRSQRDTLRNLNALARLPFTYDTYAGANFRRLTDGLERAVASPVDAFFGPAVRVYARLVDAAPDFESAAESFASLCEAAHLRCIARTVNYSKSVAAVCLCLRCLSTVCKRGATAGSNKAAAKPVIVEFVAAITAGPLRRDNECGPYGILCCADPTATWFDRVAKCHSTRTAFFECLAADRTLLNAAVASFCDWMTEPAVPVRSAANDDRSRAASTVKYACFLHATHLLAKMFAYRAARTMFPVKVSKTARIHPTGISNYCLGFLSANRDGVPDTLARALCDLVTAIAAFRTEVVDSIMGNLSKFGLRVLAEAVHHQNVFDAVVKRDGVLDELFRTTHWKDDSRDDRTITAMDSLTRIAVVLSERHEAIWRFITRRMSFLEATVARRKGTAATSSTLSLMTKMRCTPLGELTYDMDYDGLRPDDMDWRDPQMRLMFSVSCATRRGRNWLDRIDAFRSLDAFVESRLNEAETSLDLDFDPKSLDSIVDVAYSYCASIGGLEILLGDRDGSDDTGGRSELTEIYHLSYENFDDHRIPRDALVTLWLRLMEVATHTLSLRLCADIKLNYQETLLKFLRENSTENGIVYHDRTTELLTKLQRSPESINSYAAAASTGETATSVSPAVTSNADDHGSVGVWLRRAHAKIIRSDQISGAEMMDFITSFGRQRFGEQLDPDTFDCRSDVITDYDCTGIRLALRYGSSVGLIDGNSAASELEQIYGTFERRGSTRLFDCAICTLFIASQGSKNKCIEACSILLKLKETTRFVWSAASDGDADSRAAFGHLVEELLQRELPEVHNAFKMSGVSWWLLCSGWMSDCFWGRLIWPEICRWMCLIVLSPIDYQLLFFICIAEAQKQQWLEAFNRGRFHDVVFQDNFYNFRLVDHADYLENLAKKYKQSLSKRLVFEFDTD